MGNLSQQGVDNSLAGTKNDERMNVARINVGRINDERLNDEEGTKYVWGENVVLEQTAVIVPMPLNLAGRRLESLGPITIEMNEEPVLGNNNLFAELSEIGETNWVAMGEAPVGEVDKGTDANPDLEAMI